MLCLLTAHPDDGIYVMFKEIVDNAVDEFIMGNGRRVDISINETTFTIRDYGRGIPQGKLIEAVSKLNTGGKYDSKAFLESRICVGTSCNLDNRYLV